MLIVAWQSALAQDQDENVTKAGEPSIPPPVVRHRIGLGVDLMRIANRDDGASPMLYAGFSLPLRLSYRYQGERHQHWLTILYSKTAINAGALHSAISHDSTIAGEEQISHTADYSHRELQYGYGYTIASALNNRLKISPGILWDNLLFFRYYTYGYRSPDEREPNILTWEAAFSFSAGATFDYEVDDVQSLSASLHFPFLAYVVRPRYAVQDDELIKIDLDNFSQLNTGRGRFVSIDQFFQVQARFLYQRALSPLLDLQLLYQLNYYQYGHPWKVVTAMNSLGAGVSFKF